MEPTIHLLQELEKYIKLSTGNADLVVKNVVLKEYAPSEYFIESGEKSNKIGFVISGVFRYYFIDNKGNEISSYFMKENDFVCNLTSFFEFSLSSGSIQAETNCTVVEFTRSSWDLFCTTVPNWESAFQKIINETLIAKTNFQRSLINQDAKSSYLKFLNYYPTVSQRVPLNHIASFLGITPFSLSRIRKSNPS